MGRLNQRRTSPRSGSVRIGSERYDVHRVRRALRRSSNWTELVKFVLVGGSGYVVNLTVFAAILATVGQFRVAAVGAFVLSLANNYALNRRWTFAHDDAVTYQAPRYVAVSLTAFGLSLALLEVGVTVVGLPALMAQAVAIVLVAPLNYVGNKVWTFADGRRRRER